MTGGAKRTGAPARRAANRRGRLAESLAVLVLRSKGYRVVARRYRCPVGEIDVIARRGGLLVAVEVKARASFAAAAEAVDRRQRARIERALGQFVAGRPALAACQPRFDVVLVEPWRWPRHLADAWRPDAPR